MKLEETIDKLESLLDMLSANKAEKDDEHKDCTDDECRVPSAAIYQTLLMKIEEIKYYLAEKVNKGFYDETMYNGYLIFCDYLYVILALSYGKKESFKGNMIKFKETANEALSALEKLGKNKLK